MFQIVEPTTCRENVNLELKYLDPINKDSDISLYENMSDFEIINRENNIVEHFERYNMVFICDKIQSVWTQCNFVTS